MPDRTAGSGRGSRFGNLTALALSCVVSLLILEWSVRMIHPQDLPEDPHRIHPRDFYANHPKVGFTMNPAFHGRFRHDEFDTQVRISSLGIRDVEYGPKPAGVRRVLILGDSYAFGWGVEADQRFGSRLAARLAATAPGRWQVVQAGINAYSTREELAWLDEYGWPLAPDLIVLEFCMGNDFSGNVAPGFHVENGWLVGNGPRPSRAGEPWLTRLKNWLRDHSHLFVLARELRNDWRNGVGPTLKRRLQFERANAEVDEDLPATERLLGALNDDAKQHQVPWVLMVVPMRHQIYGESLEERPILDHPNAVLRGLSHRVGFPELDLLDGFREWEASHQPRTYFASDPHWNAAGHELSAQALFQFMSERGIIDPAHRSVILPRDADSTRSPR